MEEVSHPGGETTGITHPVHTASQPESSLGLTMSTFGGSDTSHAAASVGRRDPPVGNPSSDAAATGPVESVSTEDIIINNPPATLPKLRSRHRGTAYRKQLRLLCAEGDSTTIWIPKLRTVEAKLPQLDHLFDDPAPSLHTRTHVPRPKAQHPWNRKVSAGKRVESNIIPESTREPPMPYTLMPPDDTAATVAPTFSAAVAIAPLPTSTKRSARSTPKGVRPTGDDDDTSGLPARTVLLLCCGSNRAEHSLFEHFAKLGG